MPGARLHPQPCVQIKKHTSVVTTGTSHHPTFPAQWCYGLLRALPGDRLSCHHPRCDAEHRHQVDVSVETSGPHDFAVRVPITRQLTGSRPSHPALNVRDDRDTPLL